MALNVGDRLGHYDVVALIGEGGMGQVYQATDTKLNRQVALKILPEAFATDPDRLARFQREAQVLASLNHPGIAQIYGIEDTEGTKALVLELVEGPTLADRIAQGPIPVDEALPMAKQIAEALEAAHEAGVIHRDLKPANIKVREDGTVKVLDFGLAKALDTSQDADPSESPTLTAAATRAGVILGTAAYMSPEQAKGQRVDRRTDVWAFGCVLHEMLSGARAFTGDNVSETVASVLRSEPDWDALPDDTPPRVSTLLRRCLEKEPKQRVHDIADVRLAMDGAFQTTDSTVDVAGSQRTLWRESLPWVAGISLAVTTGLAVWTATRPALPQLVRFSVSPDNGESLTIAEVSPDVAISPNGTYIAYLTGGNNTGATHLRIRPMAQETSETLVADGAPISPFFSADSQSVAFADRSTRPPLLKRVSVQGGPTSVICELSAGDLRGASWGVDDTIVFATGSGLWRVAAGGGEPERLTTPDVEQGERGHSWPEILPGGESVLFTINSDDGPQAAVLSRNTSEQKVVLRGASYSRYSPRGHLVYAVQGDLWAVGFDLSRLETVGDPVPVQEGVLTKTQGVADFGLSENGSLIYVSGSVDATNVRTLVWVDRDGREEAIPAPARDYAYGRVSSDGTRIALDLRDEEADVWVWDRVDKTFDRLTFNAAREGYGHWSHDGERVFFNSDRDGPNDIYWKAADGTGAVERVTESENRLVVNAVTPDGTAVIAGDEGGDLVLARVDGAPVIEPLVATEFLEANAALSPDGAWVAFESNESGRTEVYVRPFPNVGDGRWPVSTAGGVYPVWSPDGRELFYLAPGDQLMAAPIETDTTFVRGTPELLFDAAHFFFGYPGRNYDVAPDGRFLMFTSDDQVNDAPPLHISVVLNWAEELMRLMPVN